MLAAVKSSISVPLAPSTFAITSMKLRSTVWRMPSFHPTCGPFSKVATPASALPERLWTMLCKGGRKLAAATANRSSTIIPKKFFHTAGNFREHHEEATKAGFSHPVMPWIVFFQNVDAIIGHEEPVIFPEHLTQELDYELELAIVLKKSGKHFTPEDSAGFIGGYVIFNDITARDIQRREMKSGVFSFCKAIDTFCPLGPWIVTADEIPDAHNLAMQLRVNGEPRQNSHSSKMSVKIPEILSHYSPMGYSAGDVVSTGTVSGVAAFSGDPKAWYLKPGDVMECEIEKIGILRNPVISWEQAYGKKPPALATQESFR